MVGMLPGEGVKYQFLYVKLLGPAGHGTPGNPIVPMFPGSPLGPVFSIINYQNIVRRSVHPLFKTKHLKFK